MAILDGAFACLVLRMNGRFSQRWLGENEKKLPKYELFNFAQRPKPAAIGTEKVIGCRGRLAIKPH